MQISKVVTRSQARNESKSITPTGIDSQATITVINDESYFSTWDKQTRTLIAFNQKETRNVKTGIVDLKLVDEMKKIASHYNYGQLMYLIAQIYYACMIY